MERDRGPLRHPGQRPNSSVPTGRSLSAARPKRTVRKSKTHHDSCSLVDDAPGASGSQVSDNSLTDDEDLDTTIQQSSPVAAGLGQEEQAHHASTAAESVDHWFQLQPCGTFERKDLTTAAGPEEGRLPDSSAVAWSRVLESRSISSHLSLDLDWDDKIARRERS